MDESNRAIKLVLKTKKKNENYDAVTLFSSIDHRRYFIGVCGKELNLSFAQFWHGKNCICCQIIVIKSFQISKQ